MNQYQQSDRGNFIRNAILAILVAGGIWYYLQPAAHKSSANPKAEIIEIGIANAGSFQISMWVPAGSTSDTVPGIAHVLEHLKFKTKDGAGFSGFDAIPGSSSNAATSYETTRYDLNVPPEGLEKALETLSTILFPLKISDADVKVEKSIVQQELLQRTQSDPDTPFFQDFFSKLYRGLPNENSPGGTQASVESVKLQEVLDFDAAHYNKSKVFMLIAGPEMTAQDRSIVDLLFPESAIARLSLSRNYTLDRADAELQNRPLFLENKKFPEIPAEEFTSEKTSPRARTVKYTYAKIISAPTEWQSVIAAHILRSAVISRLPDGLHDKIAEDQRMVQSWTFSVERLYEGMWQVNFSADVENGIAPEDVRLAFETYFAHLAKTGLSAESFERLKQRNFLLSEWESTGIRATRLAEDSMQYGYPKAVGLMESLQTSKVEDVNYLLKILQKPGRVGVALLKPEGANP